MDNELKYKILEEKYKKLQLKIIDIIICVESSGDIMEPKINNALKELMRQIELNFFYKNGFYNLWDFYFKQGEQITKTQKKMINIFLSLRKYYNM